MSGSDKKQQGVPDLRGSNTESFLSTWADTPLPDPDNFDPSAFDGQRGILPELVDPPGYKAGWVPWSTTLINESDRAFAARKLGWRPIEYEEMAKYDRLTADTYRVKSGDRMFLQIKDLVACRIDIRIWNKIQNAYRQHQAHIEDSLAEPNEILNRVTDTYGLEQSGQITSPKEIMGRPVRGKFGEFGYETN